MRPTTLGFCCFAVPLVMTMTIVPAGCMTGPVETQTTSVPPPPLTLPVSPAAQPSFELFSAALNETRHLNVYVPPAYETQPNDRFPVLYMPDGGLAEDFPHVAAAVAKLIGEGAMRPVIVVGIENTERRRDMTGPTEVESDRKIAAHVGGSAAFRTFIREELKPEVARRYRTEAESGIIGESLAGLFIVETFLLEPTLFNRYIAISPSLWWNHEALVRGASGQLGVISQAGPRALYLTSADEDNIVPPTNALTQTLWLGAPKSLTWIYEPRPDEHHDTIYLASEQPALRWAFAP